MFKHHIKKPWQYDQLTRTVEELNQEILIERRLYKTRQRFTLIIASLVVVILLILIFTQEYRVAGRINSKMQHADSLLTSAHELSDRVNSMVATLDSTRLDKLNATLRRQEDQLSSQMQTYESMLARNKEMEELIMKNLPANPRADFYMSEYYQTSGEGSFTIRGQQSVYKRYDKDDVYLIFSDGFDFGVADVLMLELIKVESDGSTYASKAYYYRAEGRYNKLPVTFDMPKGNYRLAVGYIQSKNDDKTFYKQEFDFRLE